MAALLMTVLVTSMAASTQEARIEDVVEMLRRGAFDEAEPYLRKLVEMHPSAQTHYLLGLCLVGVYAYEEAESHLRQATDARPTEHAWLHTLAKSLSEQGKNGEAMEALDRAIALHDAPEYHFSKAMSALDLGDLGLAEKELRVAVEGGEPMRFIAGGKAVESKEEARYQLARVLLMRGEEKEGEALLRETLTSRPDHLDARFQLGLLEKRAGNNEAACGSFEAVLRALPTHYGALYNLYGTLVSLGREEDARERLTAIKSLGEVNDQIQYLLVGADSLEHALRTEERNTSLLRELVQKRLTLAGLLLKVGRSDEALQHALAARRRAPERGPVYLLLAQVFERLGRRADAERAEAYARVLARRTR